MSADWRCCGLHLRLRRWWRTAAWARVMGDSERRGQGTEGQLRFGTRKEYDGGLHELIGYPNDEKVLLLRPLKRCCCSRTNFSACVCSHTHAFVRKPLAEGAVCQGVPTRAPPPPSSSVSVRLADRA